MLVALLLITLNCVAETTPEQRFAHARRLMQEGDLANALVQLDTLRTDHPADVDYAFARARVLERLGRPREAIDELQAAVRLAPDYEAVWQSFYALLSEQRGSDARQQRIRVRAAAAERFPSSAWWRVSVDDPEWNVLLGTGYDALSNRLPSWNDQFVEIGREVPSSGRIALRLGRFERYDATDTVVALRAERRLDKDWFAGGGVAFAGDAAFQARASADFYAGKPFGDGWVGTLAYKHKSFDDVDVGSIMGTAEKYVGEFRVAYALTASRLDGAATFFGHSLTANWYVDDAFSAGLTLSSGKEAELLGNGRVLESDVRGIVLSGRFRLTQRIDLQAWAGTHEQGGFYRRDFLGLAVSIRL